MVVETELRLCLAGDWIKGGRICEEEDQSPEPRSENEASEEQALELSQSEDESALFLVVLLATSIERHSGTVEESFLSTTHSGLRHQFDVVPHQRWGVDARNCIVNNTIERSKDAMKHTRSSVSEQYGASGLEDP